MKRIPLAAIGLFMATSALAGSKSTQFPLKKANPVLMSAYSDMQMQSEQSDTIIIPQKTGKGENDSIPLKDTSFRKKKDTLSPPKEAWPPQGDTTTLPRHRNVPPVMDSTLRK